MLALGEVNSQRCGCWLSVKCILKDADVSVCEINSQRCRCWLSVKCILKGVDVGSL